MIPTWLPSIIVFITAYNLVRRWNPCLHQRVLFLLNYVGFYFVVMMIGGVYMSLVGLWRPFNPENSQFGTRIMCYVALYFGFHVQTIGEENTLNTLDDTFLVIVNHQSLFDIMVASVVWPDRCLPIMKRELFSKTGPFGLACWLNGCVFIDRGDHRSALETCDTTLSKMKHRKLRTLLFPEATRGWGNELLPFKKGAFNMAKQGNVRLMPVVISRLSHVIKFDQWRFVPGKVIVSVLPAISPEGKTVDELLNEAYLVMNNEYLRINQLLPTN